MDKNPLNRPPISTIRLLLSQKLATTDLVRERETAALRDAAMRGHKDVVALLLDKGEADVAATDKDGKDGVTLRGGGRAQGRGRAAVGQDGGPTVAAKDEMG